MAVILSNIDMPKSCEDCHACEYTGLLYRCVLLQHEVGDNVSILHNRANDCPLKSTDEMKADLEKVCHTFGLSIVDMKNIIVEIINEYCDKENKDE